MYVKTCMRVVLCQIKKGLPSLSAFLPPLPASHVWERSQGAFIHDLLLSDLAPPRHYCGVILVCRPAVDEIARPGLVDPILRVIEPVRIRHGIEVIEVAKEFVEAVNGWEILIQVPKVVFAKLGGFVADGFQDRGESRCLIGHAHICASLAYGRQTRADG